MSGTPARHRWLLTFQDRELEDAYRRDQLERTIRQVRAVLGLAVGLAAIAGLGLLADPSTITDESNISLTGSHLLDVARIYMNGLVVPALALAFGLTFSRRYLTWGHPVAAFALLVSLSSVATALWLPPEGYDELYPLLIFVACTVPSYLGLHLRFPYAVAACGGSSLIVSVALMAGPHDLPLLDRSSVLFWLAVINVIGVLLAQQNERRARTDFILRRTVAEQSEQLAIEKAKSENVLRNVLPPSVADRLKESEEPIADAHGEVSVLFADIAGFTSMAARLSPEALVERLNVIFSRFDEIAAEQGLEKIKTIGDAYMVAAGLPEPREDHAEAVAEMALAMREVMRELSFEDAPDLDMRIGLATGPVVAGVIGRSKFAYDLWGDTVNTASRMESHGERGRIQVTGPMRERLEGRYRLSRRGEIEVKGKGAMQTWWLEGRAGADEEE